MLSIDLMDLETPERFQHLCTRLARRRFPKAMAIKYAAWDLGADIVNFEFNGGPGTIIWQCKFTSDLGSNTRRAIRDSLRTGQANFANDAPGRRRRRRTRTRWILCLPVDPTGHFLQWLRKETAATVFDVEVWGRTELLAMLDQNRDLVETFFFEKYEALRAYFQTDELELVHLELDPACAWRKPDPETLEFAPKGLLMSADLIFDVVVRNRGSLETVLTGLVARVRDFRPQMHGYPGEGLLLPKITYRISIGHGIPGDYTRAFRKYLRIKPSSLERFRIRLTDTGFGWNGFVQLGLHYGAGRELTLPCVRLYT